MPHPLARWGCDPGDEGGDRLLHVVPDPAGGLLFCPAADFADQKDRLRVRVVVEQLQAVDELHADDRVAANADAG